MAVKRARAALNKQFKPFLKAAGKDIAKQVQLGIDKIHRADVLTEAQVSKILADLDFQGWSVVIDPTTKTLRKIYADGAMEALQQIGIDLDKETLDVLNEKALQYAQDRAAELVGMKNIGTTEEPEWTTNPNAEYSITESTRENLRWVVTQSIEEGWSPQELSREIEDSESFSKSRSMTIARTETAFADSAGNMAAYRESGVVSGKKWIKGSEHDGDDICDENADAGVIGIDEEFPSGDDYTPAHPNCLVSGTEIAAVGISKQFKRRFHGEIIIMSIAGHNDISITPNHPVLTSQGWIAAGLLRKGDNLIYCSDVNSAFSRVCPDDEQVVSRIEDVSDALIKSGGMASAGVPTTSEDFHGDDSIDNKVDIVMSASDLMGNASEKSGDFGKKCRLKNGHSGRVGLNSNGAVDKIFMGTLHPTYGGMGSGRPSLTNIGGDSGSLDDMGITLSSDRKPSAMKSIPESRTMAPDSLTNIACRFAEHVGLVEIKNIKRAEYFGHVYNLQTKDGWYFVNISQTQSKGKGIIVHNCECDVIPVVDMEEDDAE